MDTGFQLIGKIKDFFYIGDVTTYIVELSNSTRIEALLPNSVPAHAKLLEIVDAVMSLARAICAIPVRLAHYQIFPMTCKHQIVSSNG